MKALALVKMMGLAALAATIFATEASAETSKPVVANNVVLVHGAWADGSSWSEVVSRLQAAGMHVTAVQNPLSSLAESGDTLGNCAARWPYRAGRTFVVWHSCQ